MRGVVVIPNGSTALAAIQRSDGFIVVVESPKGIRLNFLDTVEVGEVEAGSRMWVSNLTLNERIEVRVKKIALELTWEEKMAMVGKRTS